MARVVLPGVPHHITQRGNRRAAVFSEDADYLRYIELLELYSRQFGLQIAAYCLMGNHVHVVGLPNRSDSIAWTFKYSHGVYATEFNKKYRKSGHLWQARPFSCVLDAQHTVAALRYVERNPVRAGMVARAEDYRWSSAAAHCGMGEDPLLTASCPEVPDARHWSSWLAGDSDFGEEQRIRDHTFSGRPCGSEDFIRRTEAAVGRCLTPGKPGPKPRNADDETQPLLWTNDDIRH
jgi:putative transposase